MQHAAANTIAASFFWKRKQCWLLRHVYLCCGLSLCLSHSCTLIKHVVSSSTVLETTVFLGDLVGVSCQLFYCKMQPSYQQAGKWLQ